MSNSLDPDQDQHFVGPDLGPNCLPRLRMTKVTASKKGGYDVLQAINERTNLFRGRNTVKPCYIATIGKREFLGYNDFGDRLRSVFLSVTI